MTLLSRIVRVLLFGVAVGFVDAVKGLNGHNVHNLRAEEQAS